ncbi:merozoite surface protein 3, putative [Plasmodium vivax]|uniref:Merozoite surface protein 3, putative n=1 Tax=Plasmodium vivax TaxID=5855 RepID=A0A565A7Q7_PLAVI|nr:merozoite surface protein 3, putative [Plasmodium vivax]
MRQFFGTTILVLFLNLYVLRNNVVSNEIVNLKNPNLRNGWAGKDVTLQDEQSGLDAKDGGEVNTSEDQNELLHKLDETSLQTQGQENDVAVQSDDLEKAKKAKADAVKAEVEAEQAKQKILKAEKETEKAKKEVHTKWDYI